MAIEKEITLSELDAKFGELLKRFPEERRKLMEKSADKMESQVKANIAALGTNTGNLASAVTKAVGSGGGYAAVRNDHKKAPHAHLLEDGHFQEPGRFIPGYWEGNKFTYDKDAKTGMRLKTKFVPGRHMYRNALNSLKNELVSDAEKMLNNVAGDVFD